MNHKYRTILMKDGKRVSVSPEDYEWATSQKWRPSKDGFHYHYVQGGKGKQRALHREILTRMLGRELAREERTDHKNRDTTDHRRQNLRIASASQNAANMWRASNTSGFKGVRRHRKQWVTQLTFRRNNHYIGTFSDPEEAAYVYDQWAVQLFGEFAKTNFELV